MLGAAFYPPKWYYPSWSSGLLTYHVIWLMLRLSDAYMCQYAGQSLVQIMACRLFGTKPISLCQCWRFVNCIFGNNFQGKLNPNSTKHKKAKFKMPFAKWQPFCLGCQLKTFYGFYQCIRLKFSTCCNIKTPTNQRQGKQHISTEKQLSTKHGILRIPTK